MNFKKLFFAFIFITKGVYGSGHVFDFNGNDGYYTIDTNKIDELYGRILDNKSPAARSCERVFERAFRADPAANFSLSYVNALYLKTQEDSGGQRDFGPARRILNENNLRNDAIIPRDIIDQVSNTLTTEHEKEIFKGLVEQNSQRMHREIENYNAHILPVLGPWRLSTLRNFINKGILGLTGVSPLEGAEDLFQIMKSTGFLSTNITTTQNYSYSQKIAAQDFLLQNPSIHTLVLGCGSFVPRNFASVYLRQEEAGCASCQEFHHSRKGEMTISLPGGNLDDEEGAASDIIADATSPSLWEGIREGLGGRKFKTIKDHSNYADLVQGYITSICI